MTKLKQCVLIAEDEFIIAELLTIHVQNMGLEVCGTAATAADAIELARHHRPMIVLMDMRLQGEEDGVDAALAIYESPGSKVIFVTGSREPNTIARIQAINPTALIFKPFSDKKLISAINGALQADSPPLV